MKKAHFNIGHPVLSIKQFHSFVGAVTIGTQTSLTDLSNLNRITQVQTVETQTERFNHHIAIDTTTTTSSSQNEEKSCALCFPIF